MEITFLQLASAGLYVGAILAQSRPLVQRSLAWCACILHLAGAFLAIGGMESFRLNAAHAVNFSMAFILLGFLISSLKNDIQILGLVLFPLAGVSNILTMGSTLPPGEPITLALMVHILLSVIAFSIIALGAMEAILIQILRYRLKNHQSKALNSRMPPLQTLEAILFSTITWGTIVLSAAIGTGISFVDQFFSPQVIPKTALTLMAWSLFFSVLVGRSIFHWGGRTVTRIILVGYVLLLLGFIGVKLLFAP